jgi:geranylgeranyl reductase family protein
VARRCAQQGLTTLLIEKEHLPRNKPCGGGVTESTLALFDFLIPVNLIEGECRSVQVRFGRHKANIEKPQRLAIFVSRAEFDAFLTAKAIEAGARLQEGLAVTSVEIEDRHVVVRCGSKSYCADLVVGADGAYSVVSRNVRPRFSREQIGIACDVILDREALVLEDDSRTLMQFGDVPYGYAWIFPRRGYFGVGIGGAANHLPMPKETLRKVLSNWSVKQEPREIRWHVLPAGGFPRNTYTDRIMLVGDAAGYVDPLLGGGIEPAIQSGIYAAETAIYAAEQGKFDREVLSRYRKLCDSKIERSLRTRLILCQLMHRFPKLLIKPFAMSAALTNRVFAGDIG